MIQPQEDLTPAPVVPPPMPAPPPATSPPLPQTARPPSRPRPSFGEQAAKFSLYVPLAALGLGCLISTNQQDASVRLALGWLNLGLITAGFVLGVAALLSMRRFGRRGILSRAVVGTVINGLLLASFVSILAPAYTTGRARQRVVGTWRMQHSASDTAAAGQSEITFAKDGTFRMTRSDDVGVSATLAGKWVFDRKRQIGLDVERVEVGDPALAGKKILLGRVKQVDDRRLVLKNEAGDEVLDRVP